MPDAGATKTTDWKIFGIRLLGFYRGPAGWSLHVGQLASLSASTLGFSLRLYVRQGRCDLPFGRRLMKWMVGRGLVKWKAPYDA